MKIAWLIAGPFWTSSAYYQQVHLVSQHLHDWGIDSGIANPVSLEEDGEATTIKLKEYDPDVIVSFGDVQPYGYPQQIGIPMLTWFLNGGGPLAINHAWPGVTIGAVSRYAEKRLDEAGIESRYVPHAFDPSVFYPGRRASARARLGWDQEAPTVAMVGTNYGTSQWEPGPDRKNWVGGLTAFSKLLERRPEARLFIHSNMEGAVNLQEEIDKLGIADSVGMSDQDQFASGNWNFPATHIADIYRASNVYMMSSMGEGFGVPLIEAQACGIPVVATDHGPMSELVRYGEKIPSTPHPDRPEWQVPDVDKMADALFRHLDFGPWETQGIRNEFSVESVVEDHFIPALKAAVENG